MFQKSLLSLRLSRPFSTTLHQFSQLSSPQLPLSHITVLDLSRVLAGPYCTQLLGDLGARIIKVESLEGDDTRKWKPPSAVFEEENQKEELSAYYLCANRNKESICIDLTQKEGQQIVQELARHSQVLIENFKVDNLKKYGLDFQTISQQINPHIIYCSITSFGQNSSKKFLPGYDFVAQAMSGIMDITGPKEHPYKVGLACVDIMTGMYASSAILSSIVQQQQMALLQQQQQQPNFSAKHIDLSLFDVSLSMLVNQGTNYLVPHKIPQRMGNQHPNIAPYESLHASDGLFVVAVGNNSQFTDFCKILQCEEVATDSRFKENRDRVVNRNDLIPLLETKLKTQTRDYWIEALTKANIPCGPINNIKEALENPVTKERGMIWEFENVHMMRKERNLEVVGNPIHFQEPNGVNLQDVSKHRRPPFKGEHTLSILKELSYSEEQIQELKNKKVIA